MKIYAMLLTASLVSDNCVNKLWYLNAVEYNVAIKISIRNYIVTWGNLYLEC